MTYTIEEIKEKAIPIAKKYGVESLSLFGSYARGEANEKSDIDFLIDKGKIGGLISYFSFVHKLEDVFSCHVDVVTTGIEDRDFLESLMKDRVLLYEKR